MNSVILSLLLLVLSSKCNCEFFSSVAHMLKLYDSEEYLVDLIDVYTNALESQGRTLNEYIFEYRNSLYHDEKTYLEFISHPLNAFRTIKSLTYDLNETIRMFPEDVVARLSEDVAIAVQKQFLPSEEDFQGAMSGVLRIQETYYLETHDLAQGIVMGHSAETEMTASDCFVIGMKWFEKNNHALTIQWLNETFVRMGKYTPDPVDYKYVFTTLAYCNFMIGEVPNSYYWTMKELKYYPDSEDALNNKRFYEALIQSALRVNITSDDEIIVEKPEELQIPPVDRLGNYEKLCRGITLIPETMSKELKCYYHKTKSPFVQIAPFKVEEVFLDPKVLVFHDVMYDDEIEFFQKESPQRFERAEVQDSESKKPAGSRIGKTAWFPMFYHEHVARMFLRISDITSLSMATAEQLSIVNYGIGGQFEPHPDYLTEEIVGANGNRIATVTFYLNDVDAGGYTIFDKLGVFIVPKKGSAVMWFNMLENGETDPRTTHASCPVLLGTKWVANSWIHERGQEFKRPCTRPFA